MAKSCNGRKVAVDRRMTLLVSVCGRECCCLVEKDAEDRSGSEKTECRTLEGLDGLVLRQQAALCFICEAQKAEHLLKELSLMDSLRRVLGARGNVVFTQFLFQSVIEWSEKKVSIIEIIH